MTLGAALLRVEAAVRAERKAQQSELENRVVAAVQAERDRIAARMRRMVDYHADFPLSATTSHELLLGMAKAIEEGTE